MAPRQYPTHVAQGSFTGVIVQLESVLRGPMSGIKRSSLVPSWEPSPVNSPRRALREAGRSRCRRYAPQPLEGKQLTEAVKRFNREELTRGTTRAMAEFTLIQGTHRKLPARMGNQSSSHRARK